MELMDTDLTSFIGSHFQTYSENVVKFILKQILKGIAHLHSLNIIHRDIKSDNILVSQHGAVKLADFGFSCQLNPGDKRESRVGTIAWMAPELIRAKQVGYNTTIDIWSFGILAVELANGDPPNLGKSQAAILNNILNGPTPTLEDESWSDEYRDFINQCLTKNPLMRPDAQALLKHEFLADADDHIDEFKRLVVEHLEVQNSSAFSYKNQDLTL